MVDIYRATELITSELANHHVRKALFTCVVYTNAEYLLTVRLLRLNITFSFTQKLHTLFNLSDVLSHRHPGCSNTLRDDKLPDEVMISYAFVVLLQLNHFGCLQK